MKLIGFTQSTGHGFSGFCFDMYFNAGSVVIRHYSSSDGRNRNKYGESDPDIAFSLSKFSYRIPV